MIWPFSRSRHSAKFRFEAKQTQLLGVTYRPMVDVAFKVARAEDWYRMRMLVDTGADYTLLPAFWARLLGYELTGRPKEKTTGIGGVQSVSFVENVQVKLGGLSRQVPVGFASSDKIPPLLGRHLFFETFEVTFKGRSHFIFKDL